MSEIDERTHCQNAVSAGCTYRPWDDLSFAALIFSTACKMKSGRLKLKDPALLWIKHEWWQQLKWAVRRNNERTFVTRSLLKPFSLTRNFMRPWKIKADPSTCYKRCPYDYNNPMVLITSSSGAVHLSSDWSSGADTNGSIKSCRASLYAHSSGMWYLY